METGGDRRNEWARDKPPHGRPSVLVNAAISVDGKLDSFERLGAGISSPRDLARVDELRSCSDAVLVGGHTLLEGDPRLTVKSPQLRAARLARGLPENPVKVGVVSLANLDPACRFIRFGPARRLIYTTRRTPSDCLAALAAAGVEVFVLGETRVDLRAMLASLFSLGIRQLMVEGGGTLISALFHLGLVDALSLYIAPRLFAGGSAPSLADGAGFTAQQAPRLKLASVQAFDEEGGILVHYTISPQE